MSNKTVRFVTATCACGATFQREVKRGRPQKWCPDCVAVPFYERIAAPVAEVAEGEEIEAKPERLWDDHGNVRDEIEAEVAEVNAAHKVRFAALVAEGVDKFIAADQISQQLHDELLAVYVKYAPSKYAA
jgi:thiol-disulfide isomerase/thioredoxin